MTGVTSMQWTLIAFFLVTFVSCMMATGVQIWHSFMHQQRMAHKEQKEEADIGEGMDCESNDNRKKRNDCWCSLPLISCFCIISNARKLLSTQTSAPPATPGKQGSGTRDSLDALHGIRVVTMTWIILTHTYMTPLKETFAFSTRFMTAVEEPLFQGIVNAWVLVDTFFFMSALLATKSLLDSIVRKKGVVSIPQVILNRVMRLAPGLWLTVGVMRILPSLGSGPLWQEYFDQEDLKCRDNWLLTLLFANNWLPSHRICLLHTWYLSAEMQLFLLSLTFILVFLW